MKRHSPRKSAALLVQRVVDQGESLGNILTAELTRYEDPRHRALLQELTYGTLRWFFRLDAVLGQLLDRPLKRRDRDLHALLLIGLYQLLMLDIPAHAALSETVEVARQLGKDWAVRLVNGVLRNAQRRSDQILEQLNESPQVRWAHPQWWVQQIQSDWPGHWRQILEAGNRHPPMTLRVNRLRGSREACLARLAQAGIPARSSPVAEQAIELLRPVSVEALPGFQEGLVSVQDGAAQLAAPLLDLAPGQRVLDACAAPGGKTCHVLEFEPELKELVAIDSDPRRLDKVADNLRRLSLSAELVAADAAATASWWDGRFFDRILLDAPCSASGVVRRHPDIKLLRRPDDVRKLAQEQERLLEALWPLLVSGGMLLYVTCSVFSAENSVQVQRFLDRHPDAREVPTQIGTGVLPEAGLQVLPGEQGMDGFYFARMTKTTIDTNHS